MRVRQAVKGWRWVILWDRQVPPTHFLPKVETKMLDFRILYWLGQYQSSFLPTLALIAAPGKFAQPCRMSGEGLRLSIAMGQTTPGLSGLT